MPVREGVAAAEARLDIAVARLAPDLTRSRASVLVKDGAVTVDGVIRNRPSFLVPAGARLQIEVPEPAPAEAIAQDLPIRVVYEDAELLVVDKDAGMVVHPAPGHPDGTLVNALLHHVEDLSGIGGVQRPGIVHRLDRGTSGLLVVAKTDRAHQVLAAQFAEHSAGRTYLALCLGTPKADEGTIRSLLARHPTERVRHMSQKRGREAITHWRVLGRAGTVTLIECRLETGRTHQVRVHLSEQGWPILGDPLYGASTTKRMPATLNGKVDEQRPLLHAWQLHFTHPDGRALQFLAPVPADFRAALEAVGLPVP